MQSNTEHNWKSKVKYQIAESLSDFCYHPSIKNIKLMDLHEIILFFIMLKMLFSWSFDFLKTVSMVVETDLKFLINLRKWVSLLLVLALTTL